MNVMLENKLKTPRQLVACAITVLLTCSLLLSSMQALALTQCPSELTQLIEVENLGGQRGEEDWHK